MFSLIVFRTEAQQGGQAQPGQILGDVAGHAAHADTDVARVGRAGEDGPSGAPFGVSGRSAEDEDVGGGHLRDVRSGQLQAADDDARQELVRITDDSWGFVRI